MNFGWVPMTCPAKPGNSATAYFFDSTADPDQAFSSTNTSKRYKQFGGLNMVHLSLLVTGQDVTAYFAVTDPISAVWTVVNGGGSGETVTASTLFQREWGIVGSDCRVYVVAGGTAPTLWEPTFKIGFNVPASL